MQKREFKDAMKEMSDHVSTRIRDYSDEIILKVLRYLESSVVFLCGQVSKRIRAISHDESLWEKINLAKGFAV